MSNYYEKRLQEIGAMLHMQRVQETPWLRKELQNERLYILKQLDGGDKS